VESGERGLLQQQLGEALDRGIEGACVAQPSVCARAKTSSALSPVAGERIDAVLVLPDPLIISYRTRIADLATMHRLLTSAVFGLLTEAGILASYGPDLRVMGNGQAFTSRKSSRVRSLRIFRSSCRRGLNL
jgi:hypothetical protein